MYIQKVMYVDNFYSLGKGYVAHEIGLVVFKNTNVLLVKMMGKRLWRAIETNEDMNLGISDVKVVSPSNMESFKKNIGKFFDTLHTPTVFTGNDFRCFCPAYASLLETIKVNGTHAEWEAKVNPNDFECEEDDCPF